MAKMTELQLFQEKNKYLKDHYKELTPLVFYQMIFPSEQCEHKGDCSYRASNPIFSYRSVYKDGQAHDHAYFRNELVFADTYKESMKMIIKNDFALTTMCTYVGRRRTAKNAYHLNGFIIDLDGVGMEELQSFWGHVYYLDDIPCPTAVVNSGHGLHIYYVFENPVPLYPRVIRHMQGLKKGLTEVVWQKETSQISVKDRQYQGIYQTFRMVGSRSKLGSGKARDKYVLRGYLTGGKVTIAQLNRYVDTEYRAPEDPDYSSWLYADENHHTLEECKELYPEWYQRRIVEGREPEQWVCNRGLYDWWLAKIQEGRNARDGNRYHCISMLYVYGIKCQIPKEFVDADAYSLVEPFNDLTVRKDNEFTEDDVKAASKFYDPAYVKMSRFGISLRTGIEITPSIRRNGLSQKQHLYLARRRKEDMKALDIPMKGKDGRPSKEVQVKAWRKEHPGGTKTDCLRDTGLSYPTIRKWW